MATPSGSSQHRCPAGPGSSLPGPAHLLHMTTPIRESIKALRNGDTVDINGFLVRATNDQDLREGAHYVAGRNTGPHLLTVRDVVVEDNFIGGYVLAMENAYPFDVPECVVVEIVGLAA
jgi:hypothetical protein